MKFQLKKVLCMGVAVGNVAMTPDELRQHGNNLYNLQQHSWHMRGSSVGRNRSTWCEAELPHGDQLLGVPAEKELEQRNLPAFRASQCLSAFHSSTLCGMAQLQVKRLHIKSTMGKPFTIYG